MAHADGLTVLVGYDVRIDVIDRLLGLRVHWGGCTCIRRLAYDRSVLRASGSASGVLPVERRQDSSYGQGQKGRHGCQAQQQRIQHRCVGVPCRDSRCKMLDQLELLSINPRVCHPLPCARHPLSLGSVGNANHSRFNPLSRPPGRRVQLRNSRLAREALQVTFLSSAALSTERPTLYRRKGRERIRYTAIQKGA